MKIDIKDDGKGNYQSFEADLAQHFQNEMSNASIFIKSYGQDEEESQINMKARIRDIIGELEKLLEV